MHEYIRRFLDYMSGQRGCSPLTRSTYETTLTDCANYLVAHHSPIAWDAVTTAHVRAWLAHLMKSGYASNTVNRSLSALRSFFRYLLREGVVATDPAHAVRNPKAAKRIPTFVREREMDRLFAYYPSETTMPVIAIAPCCCYSITPVYAPPRCSGSIFPAST